MKALARVPDERWRGCDEMAVALDEVVHALKWGPERLASMQRELFPDEPSHSNVVRMGPLAQTAVAARNELTVGMLRRHGVAAARRVGGRRRSCCSGWCGWSRPGRCIAASTRRRRWRRCARARRCAAAARRRAPPALPTTVTVRVLTMPPGADVFLDGRARVARQDAAGADAAALAPGNVHLGMKLRGYEPQTSDVTPDSDSRLQISLQRDAAAAAGGWRRGRSRRREAGGDEAGAAEAAGARSTSR